MLDPDVEAMQLATFADRLERLAPCHRDPEAYHVAKDALVRDLRAAARELEFLGGLDRALAALPDRGPIRLGVVHADGRVVPVEARHRRPGEGR